ncbi:putative ammecr1 family protein [Rosellinia necatrix]|uniref:Putative ammecr1 family protein n=1 Tax=Rosellinia necatrix TaxID=77044 RepID=A0A1W2TJY3_ROSNE|nr:putative ammecr1 family protein [Rosellinia necatrix]
MASVSHCLYCFESLAAHLGNRKSMTLEEVQESWEKYCRDADITSKKQPPAIRRVFDSDASASSLSTPSSGSTLSLNNDTPTTSTDSLPDTEQSIITESPLFVTWNTVSSSSGHTSLRGCIGTFEAQELDEGLSSYAITSAIHDTRFDPISKRELPSLEAAVTLLTDFEDCDDAMDWELGTHGIRISFVDRGRRYGATYLPDVAPEQGWTKEETLVPR